MADKKDDIKKDEDDRLEYILQYVTRSSKVKPDKWAKLMSTDEHRVSIMTMIYSA